MRKLLLLLVAALAPNASYAQHVWRPEERVLIAPYHQIGGIALDTRRVYAVTPNGVEVYDRVRERWELPISAPQGFPMNERPTALAHERFGDVLWMGTATGGLYRHTVGFSGEWSFEGIIAMGPILRIVPVSEARESAVYVRTTDGWLRRSSASFSFEPVDPARLPAAVHAQDAALRDPAFQAMRGTLATDESLRRWPITAVAPGDLDGQAWLGTDGGNLLFFDARTLNARRYRFGLLSAGTTAIARDRDAVWFGGDGRGTRRGVTRASESLQEWSYGDHLTDGAPAGAVRAILPLADAVWFAASDGLFRFDRAGGRWSRATKLPGDRVTALADHDGALWVGTTGGLGYIAPGAEPVRAGLLSRVNALRVARDTLWIAGEAGLLVLPLRTDDGIAPAPGAESIPALRAEVLDVESVGEHVIALTRGAVYHRTAAGWQPLRPYGALVRGPHALAAAGDAVWVIAANGAARWSPDEDPGMVAWTEYRVRDDIPAGPVHDVLETGEHIWFATAIGALRVEKRH